MRFLKYLLLTLAVVFAACAGTADSESAFVSEAAQAASSSNVGVTLCDITGDGQMEMLLFSVKTGTLKVYTQGGDILTCSVSSLKAKSMAVELRKGAVGVTVTQKTGSTYYGISCKEGTLTQEIVCVISGKKYTVNGESVSKTQYTSRKSAFASQYASGGKMPVMVFSSSADVKKRFSTLESKCTTASKAKTVTLSPTSAKVSVGKSITLKAKITPATAVWEEVTYSSSNENVATVTSEGVVRAVGGGSCTITATAKSGAKKSCKITVPAPPAQSVTLSETEITIAKGEKKTLTFTLTPTGANKTVTWSSSNKKIATVSSSGLIKGVAAGDCVITVKAKSGVKASVTVHVSAVATAVNISAAKATVDAGKTLSLSAKVLPSAVNQSVEWSSENSYIASVSQKGVVTARRSGTVKITATATGGKSASCTVTVKASGTTYIIDLSQYNTVTDWKKLSQCADLIILRATCGTAVDTKFATYAAACRQYDIPFGVYCYGKAASTTAAAQEAQFLYETASSYEPLFYVYDVEKSFIKRSIASAFTQKLRALGVQKIGYYISHNLYSTLNLNTKEVDFVWIPRYGDNTGYLDKSPVYSCDLHQYTSNGSVPGISTRTDLSRLTGSKSLAWFLQ